MTKPSYAWLIGKAQSSPEVATLELFAVQWMPGHAAYDLVDVPKLSVVVATAPDGACLIVKQGDDSVLQITLPLPKESNVVKLAEFAKRQDRTSTPSWPPRAS